MIWFVLACFWFIIAILWLTGTFRKKQEATMSDNRMKYTIDSNMQFPLVEIALEAGESAYIQQGSMVYHTPSVTLNTAQWFWFW